mmetsp:Transcript_866/g.1056  ORF Transcript_866/g.1056 Transcript_866/m.1056 type:complete len:115 (+) Transcript_866:88-432(+)|eukprot:CAMPEP_0178911924 /NCGR_PEP_ID=MMETSP0786-20121207/9969_1 /TAXON_ID=186022 /ORGANISM="Thalassionema frauenfeldii, Strain CCMP 1798" /LENGTH=114 /DNA_ID=CAMNT_0020584433 /DNA_START=50 /DNA_END=394 /DNA_ORIENTATION=+
MALRLFTDKAMNFAAKYYQKAVAMELTKTGLRYEDLLNENENDISEALSMADKDVVTGRTRRVKRAIDLHLKQKNFNDYAAGVDQETFKSELYDDLLKIRARDQEYALLNANQK